MKSTIATIGRVKGGVCLLCLIPLALLAATNKKCKGLQEDTLGCVVNAEQKGCEIDEDPAYDGKCSNIEYDSMIWLCVPEPNHNCDPEANHITPVPWTEKFGGSCLHESTYEGINCWCDEDPAMGARTGSFEYSCAT